MSKGVAGFTSIAPDLAIEQENRTLKVTGGILGITQNEKALNKLFLIASSLEVSKLLHTFETEYGIDNNKDTTMKSQVGSSLE